MHPDYSKICRVCMSSATRNIFIRTIENGNPLERLLEKLRYITMMRIEENDDLPSLLCDLCIVQLNVAYNFKRQAIENDSKLRQYFIENGIAKTSTHLSSSNNTEASKSTAALNETSTISIYNSVTNSPEQHQHKNAFPVKPIIVKKEPSEEIIFTSEISPIPSTSQLHNAKSMVYLHNTPLTSDDNQTVKVTKLPVNNENSKAKPDSSNDCLSQNLGNLYYKKRQHKTKIRKNLDNSREVKKLSINMVPPMGKRTRNEIKKNVDYRLKKKNKSNSNPGANITNSNNKTETNTKKIIISRQLLNPFINYKKSGPAKGSSDGTIKVTKNKFLKPKIEPGI